jgi:hypothetical protein
LREREKKKSEGGKRESKWCAILPAPNALSILALAVLLMA